MAIDPTPAPYDHSELLKRLSEVDMYDDDAHWIVDQDKAEALISQAHDALSAATAANAGLVDDRAELVFAVGKLLPHARHSDACDTFDHPDFSCTCGMERAETIARTALAAAEGSEG